VEGMMNHEGCGYCDLRKNLEKWKMATVCNPERAECEEETMTEYKLIPISEIPLRHTRGPYYRIIKDFIEQDDAFCEVQVNDVICTTLYSGLNRASKHFEGKVRVRISMKNQKVYLEKIEGLVK